MKKKLLLLLLMFSFTFCLIAQEETVNRSNLKKLKSDEEDKVTVEIKKPDNSAIMPRKQTEYKTEHSFSIREKIKKSNKLLY